MSQEHKTESLSRLEIKSESKHSAASGQSNISSAIALKRAKAEAAKATLEYAVKEAELRKQQAQAVLVQSELDADIELLRAKKQIAETEAEVEALESIKGTSSKHSLGDKNIDLPIESSKERTKRYVEQYSSNEHSVHPAQTDAHSIAPHAHHVDHRQPVATSTPKVEPHPSHTVLSPADRNISTRSDQLPTRGHNTFPNVNAAPFAPTAPHFMDRPQYIPHTDHSLSTAGELTRFLLKKDLLLTRFTAFDDRPETFSMWKSSFVNITQELEVTANEELDLLIKWLGPESKKHAVSLRMANVNDPNRAVNRIWERLEERYGCPEMVESAIKAKLQSFPRLTNKDHAKLYELSDILSEIESLKEDPKYSTLLSYYDSSSGVLPIASKLPYNLQEKWTSKAAAYKKQYQVSFPPFVVFVEFIREISQIKNDPSFAYEYPTQQTQKKDNVNTHQKTGKTSFSTRKTEVKTQQKSPTVDKITSKCPLHNTNHTLNQCRGFRFMSIDERKNFMKEHGICFRCCSTTQHTAQNCQETINCTECGSQKHPSALHCKKSTTRHDTPSKGDGGENRDVTTSHPVNKCTQICGSRYTGKSCSKTILATVYPTDHPEKSIRAYVMLDDQSNVSLAKSAFFDHFNEHGKDIPYSLSSCAGQTQTFGRRATSYTVSSLDGTNVLHLKTLIECNNIPNVRDEIATPKEAMNHPHLQEIAPHISPLDDNADILLLIGRDIPEAHHVLEQRTGPKNAPFAQKLCFGWVIIGETCLGNVHKPNNTSVNKVHVLEDGRPTLFPPCVNKLQIKESPSSTPAYSLLEYDVGSKIFEKTKDDNAPGTSVEDRQFIKIMETEMFRSPEGNWVAPLPFKSPRQRLPDNRSQALKRAHSLHQSLEKNAQKKEHFVQFMEKVFQNNHAELAPPLTHDEERWYLPLFGVYHPQKPNQIRGVFDSSAQHQGISLNDVLLKGPDATNSLLGVLMRFRQEKIAVTADIQSMFHCFLVDEKHRNFLRFLWYADNNPDKELVEYRMRVHVFGNRPSPAVATLGLRKAAHVSQPQYGKDVVEFVERNFYVDDGLISLPTAEEAVGLIRRTQEALAAGGNLRLHKIASNCPEVIKAFPAEDYAQELKELNFDEESLPIQRSLGLTWDLHTDTFTFRVSNEVKPYTRRGVLSTISSLFDPIGFAAPFLIQGKVLLRELMAETQEWDEPLSPDRQREWEEWRDSLKCLETFTIPRTYSPTSVQLCTRKQVLVFSDASENAISAVAYMKTTDQDETEHTGFVLGKAKVAPKHGHTIPRLELCGAVLAVELGETVSNQLDVPLHNIMYYTDSKVVLGYLHNESKRFLVYVANRVDRIRKSTSPQQWSYIPTHLNPADSATRPMHALDLQNSTWITGPIHIQSETLKEKLPVSNTDENVRPPPVVKATTSKTTTVGSHRFSKFSSWIKLVQTVARLQHVAKTFAGKTKCNGWHSCQQARTVESFTNVEQWIFKQVQLEVYSHEIQCLKTNKPLSNNSPILSLNPTLDEKELLRVGGRLKYSGVRNEEKHPVIIPGKHHVATLLIRHHHILVQHQGRLFTEAAVRSAGLWITGCKRIINSLLYKCIECRKQRRQPARQKMADLPSDRLTPAPPFTYVGVDTCGPWNVVTRKTRGGSATSKRWAILFSCLVTRAIHIEVIDEMTSSAFINALRRFEAIRGKVVQYRSDRGTNFIGATDDLQINAINVEDGPVRSHLYDRGVTWIFNPPHSSHMGGSWERMIGLTKRILQPMLSNVSDRNLTHEVLTTFMSEVCAIVNSRPIVPVSTDPDSPFLLTPNTILTQKTNQTPEPLREYDAKDMYRAQWKRVQNMAEQFWKRWHREYLSSLQTRRKWLKNEPNLQQGDIILLKDKDAARNEWPMGIISDVIPSEDNRVRKVIVRVNTGGKVVTYTRPITDIVLLLSKGE